MRILLIPDKFKGSLSAKGVIKALIRGIEKVHPDAVFSTVLASDGGDGFLKAIAQNLVCEEVHLNTVDPLGRTMQSTYLLDKVSSSAFIELAKASGLELLNSTERSAMHTSTYGTGLEIKDAIGRGASKIYVGLGGSATNDAGMGIAHALGYQFLDGSGRELKPIGKHLSKVKYIEKQGTSFPPNVSVYAVNDVDNPLFGKKGAAYTYARQKGANSKEIEFLDTGLRGFSEIVKDQLKVDIAHLPGSGAAGGTAYGLKAFLKADYISGIDFILKAAQIEELLKEQKFDYIITGEGKFDMQTLNGKLIKGVADLGARHNIPVLAVCGQLDINEKNISDVGVKAALEVRDIGKSFEYNMEHAAELIEKSICHYFMNI